MSYSKTTYGDLQLLAYEWFPRRAIYRRELVLVWRAGGPEEHVSWALGGWEDPPRCPDLAERLGAYYGRLEAFELELPDLASEYLRQLPADCPAEYRARVVAAVDKLGHGYL